jgi:tellurite resistance protein TerC
MHSVANPTSWIIFTVAVLGLLALDLGVFHRRPHAISLREAGTWSAVWIALAGLFGGYIYFQFGSERALEFSAAYLVEKSLSVDNLFVFVAIFGSFAVPPQLQHRVLFWGVIGALVLRAIFIALGAVLLEHFHAIIYVFGAILLITAYRLLREKPGEEANPQKSAAYKLFQRFIPSTHDYHGNHMLVRVNGRLLATPLLAVLLVVEVSDVIFAVDSIPAVFAVTDDPFIVYTSNVFAILGLRSLYFLLADVVHRFRFLKLGLVGILSFVGVKMMIADFYKVPIVFSLAFIALALAIAIVASLLIPVPESEKQALKHPVPAPDAPKPGPELEPSRPHH